MENNRLNSRDGVLNIEYFQNNLVSVGEITDRMMKFFTNDKCNREILSNFEGREVVITGRYQRFGYRYHRNMLVQEGYINVYGQLFSLKHLWLQNVYNSGRLKMTLKEGDYITFRGIVEKYNTNDNEFPYEQSYGINYVEVLY